MPRGYWLQVAPYDFLQADDRLSQADIDRVLRDCHMWMADGCYALLPWSCCVLESIPWDAAPSFAPYSVVKPMQQ